MTEDKTTPPNPETPDPAVDAEEKRVYDDLADRASGYLKRTQEVTTEAVSAAVSQAKQAANAAGEFSSDQVDRASRYLNRDLLDIQQNSEKARTFFTRSLAPSRIKNGMLALASDVLEQTGSGLSRLSDRLEAPLMVRTGEVTGPGTLTCVECDSEMHYEDSGRIPPCPKCHKTAFKKSY